MNDTPVRRTDDRLARKSDRTLKISAGAVLLTAPALHGLIEDVKAGALISYGANLRDLYGRAVSYVDKILRNSKPVDLPVQQPTTFELAINLKTAKALGLAIPPTLLARVDEVIE